MHKIRCRGITINLGYDKKYNLSAIWGLQDKDKLNEGRKNQYSELYALICAYEIPGLRSVLYHLRKS